MIMSQTGDMEVFFNASTATNATARGYVDTLGFDAVDIIIAAAKAAATDASASFTSIAIQHSNTTDATNFSTIMSGTTGTPTSSQFSLTANNNTNVFTAYRVTVNKHGRGRYVGAVIQAPTGYNTNVMVAFKSRSKEGPSSTGGALAHGII